MTILRKSIVTQMNFVAILTKSLHLIVDLFADATNFRKTMIDKEKYLHYCYFDAKIEKNLDLHKIIPIFVFENRKIA